MIGPTPENIARLDADWDADARAAAEALDDFYKTAVKELDEGCTADDSERRLLALEAAEDQRRRDVSTRARCERLGIVVAKRMPVIHQRRCGRTGR